MLEQIKNTLDRLEINHKIRSDISNISETPLLIIDLNEINKSVALSLDGMKDNHSLILSKNKRFWLSDAPQGSLKLVGGRNPNYMLEYGKIYI